MRRNGVRDYSRRARTDHARAPDGERERYGSRGRRARSDDTYLTNKLPSWFEEGCPRLCEGGVVLWLPIHHPVRRSGVTPPKTGGEFAFSITFTGMVENISVEIFHN